MTSDTEGPSVADKRELTVEQLAYETGMSVRNIRNHQSRGLLPPPEVRARVGYYGQEHVDRLRLIQQMQAEGFKLSAIQRLIGDHGGSADRFVGLRRALTVPFETESPEILTTEELAERFPGDFDPKLLQRAERIGGLVPVGDGRFEAPSPALLRAAEEVVAQGIGLEAAIEAIERVHRNTQSAARTFVRLFLEELWKPFNAAGRPAEGWEEITETIERLRPVASDVVVALFRQTMATEMEEAFGKVLLDQGRRR